MKLALAICASAPVVFLLFLTGCGSSSGPSDREVLISLTDEVIVPAYQELGRETASLNQAVNTLCGAPNAASLDTARQSWRAARGAWMRSEAMWFGPVLDRRSTSLLDWSPTDTSGIDRLLAEGSPTTAEEVRNVLGSNRRGFGAIGYLLFRNDDLADPSRAVSVCPYLVALAAVAHEETGAILNEWAEVPEGRPAYRDYFIDRASSSMLPTAAVGDVVRTVYFLIRDIVDVRLASAMGLRQDPADPSAIPGTSADNGLNDIGHELMGMRTVYEGPGDEGLGIGDLVSQLSEDTDARLRNEFDAATGAIESVSGPFRFSAVQRTPQVETLYERLLDVQRTIATEVVSLLGVHRFHRYGRRQSAVELASGFYSFRD